jgi:hypothetical protein
MNACSAARDSPARAANSNAAKAIEQLRPLCTNTAQSFIALPAKMMGGD